MMPSTSPKGLIAGGRDLVVLDIRLVRLQDVNRGLSSDIWDKALSQVLEPPTYDAVDALDECPIPLTSCHSVTRKGDSDLHALKGDNGGSNQKGLVSCDSL